MKQYCRYCAYLVTGNGIYCTARNITMRESTTKCVNHCEDFNFNEIDAFGETNGYKPRRSKNSEIEAKAEQLRIEGVTPSD